MCYTHNTQWAHLSGPTPDKCEHSRSDWFESLPEAVSPLETVPLRLSSVCVCVCVLWGVGGEEQMDKGDMSC